MSQVRGGETGFSPRRNRSLRYRKHQVPRAGESASRRVGESASRREKLRDGLRN